MVRFILPPMVPLTLLAANLLLNVPPLIMILVSPAKDPAAYFNALNAIKEKLLCVRGNCDTEVDQMVLEFPVLADYAVFYVGGRMIYATHGHVYNEGKLPPLQKGDVLLHGHTHVPKCTDHGDYLYLNPGSVSIPKENSPHSYLLLQDTHLQWKTLDGEVYMERDL